MNEQPEQKVDREVEELVASMKHEHEAMRLGKSVAAAAEYLAQAKAKVENVTHRGTDGSVTPATDAELRKAATELLAARAAYAAANTELERMRERHKSKRAPVEGPPWA